jgi:DNA-binding NtrC family response regulator
MAKGKILIVDDEELLCNLLGDTLTTDGYEVQKVYDGQSAINLLQENDYDVVILDLFLPQKNGIEVLKYISQNKKELQVIMATGYSDISSAVEALKMGAFDFLLKPFDINNLKIVLQRALEKKREIDKNRYKRKLTHGVDLIGESNIFKQLLDKAVKAAHTNAPVLLLGPSGSGKECIAQYIHQNSSRNEKSFIPINCSSFPENLLESELFGHEKGAYTGAISTKKGLVEEADEGTLFLDEVGDVPIAIQPKLLRFIETGEFRRVGGNETLKVNVQIISATNKNLDVAVGIGQFRSDLYFRLKVITLQVPPLNERREDIPLLVNYFLKKHNPANPKSLSPEALNKMLLYNFPGNIRELENILKKAELLSNERIIHQQDLEIEISENQTTLYSQKSDVNYSITDMEKHHIQSVLKSNNWNKSKSADILGISLKTLYSKIKEYGLRP